MNNKLNLSSVTLCCVSNVKHNRQLEVLNFCSKEIIFGEVLFITNTNSNIINDKIKIIETPLLNNISYPKDWSEFMIYDLKNFIQTDFLIFVHHDGFIVNPQNWNDDFLNYDYIGAPWPKNMFMDDFSENIRVGNGGFSLRSKKLLHIFTDLNIKWEAYRDHWHDDGFISMANINKLRQHGIKIPTADLAYKFSRELYCDDLDNTIEPFGVHGFFNNNEIYKNYF